MIISEAYIKSFFPESFKYEHFTPAFDSSRTQIKKLICTRKPVLNVRFKDFWFTKLNLTQIWYEELN